MFKTESFDPQESAKSRSRTFSCLQGLMRSLRFSLSAPLCPGERGIIRPERFASLERTHVISCLGRQVPIPHPFSFASRTTDRHTPSLFAMRPKLVVLAVSQDNCEFCKLLPLDGHVCSYAPSSCTCSKRSTILLRTLGTVSLNPLRLKYVLHRPSTREQLRALAGYLDGPLEAEVISDWWVGSEKRV